MLRIALFFAVAMIATLPGAGVASLYLRKRGIPAGEGVVPTFLKEAPPAVRAAVLGLNFLVFGLLMTALWFFTREP